MEVSPIRIATKDLELLLKVAPNGRLCQAYFGAKVLKKSIGKLISCRSFAVISAVASSNCNLLVFFTNTALLSKRVS